MELVDIESHFMSQFLHMPSGYNNASYRFCDGDSLDNYVICFHFLKIKETILIRIISMLISEGTPSFNSPSINHGEKEGFKSGLASCLLFSKSNPVGWQRE